MSIKDDIEAACVAALCQAETNEDINGPPAHSHANSIRRGVAAIRRIVEATKWTKDGHPIISGMMLHSIRTDRHGQTHAGISWADMVECDEPVVPGDPEYGPQEMSGFYSTSEVAEAAHRLANGPHDHDDADGRAGESDA